MTLQQKANDELTVEGLRRLFTYNEKTGKLLNRRARGSAIRGAMAGSLNQSEQQMVVSIKGKPHKVHRIVWLMMYGELPSNIYHRDGNKLNNKLDNLTTTASKNKKPKPKKLAVEEKVREKDLHTEIKRLGIEAIKVKILKL